MKIGHLGPRGTFSEYSALIYSKNLKDVELVSFNTIHDVIMAVANGIINEAIVPLENSIEGSVNTTIDTIIFDVELYIKKEVVIDISQNLMVKRENNRKNIIKILSHYQGLAQCNDYIRNNYPQCDILPVKSTAEASSIVSNSTEPWACIGNSHSAKIYDLEIIDKDIQDNAQNQTRFIVLSKEFHGFDKKTSIIFSTENKPGGLYKILDILAIWDLNMTKIESRPMKNKLGSYVFFIDFETDKSEDIQNALKMVKRKTSYFKFLGSYNVFLGKENL